MTKARDISKLLSTANGKIAGENLDVSFENITDTGTEGTKVATGTTAQRGSTAGQLRFNTTTGLAEYYTGTEFKAIDIAPLITSLNNSNISQTQIDGGFDLVITGTNFSSGATVKFIGNDGTEYSSPTVTVNSDTQITARVNTNIDATKEPFDVQVTSAGGLSSIKEDGFNINATPTWNTASGNLGTINDKYPPASHFTLSATDPEGGSVSYTESTSNLSGAGLSLSSAGVITGDPTDVASDTTISFGVNASDGTNTVNRSFNIIVRKTLDGSTSALASTPLSIRNLDTSFQGSSANGLYWIKDSNINSGTPIQIYLDMDKGNTAWALIISNNATTDPNWTDSQVQSNNTGSAGLTAFKYSILSWADAFKPASGSWQYMIEGNTGSNKSTRYYAGGVFTANVNSYSMNTTSPSQTNVTANEFFSTNISGHQTSFADNVAIGGRVPWRGGNGANAEALYTTYPDTSSWWGTMVTNSNGWSGYKAGAFMSNGVLDAPEQTRVWVRSYI